MTLTYEDLFSRFLARVKDNKLLSLSSSEFYEIMNDYLHISMSNPVVENVFTTLIADDDIEEIEYELKNSVNEFSDKNFVLEILTQSLVIQWMTQHIDTDVSLSNLIIGGKEEKVLLNNLTLNMDRLASLEKKLQKTVRNHGYYNGSYVEE